MDRLGSADRRIGTEIAGYRVEAVLSCGLSESLLAVEPLSRRAVVLKLIDVELARDQGLGARLEQIGVGFRDPLDGSIARVLELREEPERLILVREWVDGDDVAALLEGQALCDPDIAIGLVAQAALCLHGARWGHGVVHGNLKPSNVFVEPAGKPNEERRSAGRMRLADFGLWLPVERASLASEASMAAGVSYLAPELIMGEDPTTASDQYALGCLLYESLVGSAPFVGEVGAVASAHVQTPPPSVRERRTEVGETVDLVIERALAKRPEDRFVSCADLATALTAARTTSARGETRANVAGTSESSSQQESAPTAIARSAPAEQAASTAGAASSVPAAAGSSARRRQRVALGAVAVVALTLAVVLSLVLIGGGDESAASDPVSSGGEPEASATESTRGGSDAASALPFDASSFSWSRIRASGQVVGETEELSGRMNSVTVGGPGLVAVGEAEFDAAVWTSEDGVSWSRLPEDEAILGGASAPWERMNGVTVGGPGLVAVGFEEDVASGLGAAVWTSIDGLVWSRVGDDESVFGGPGSQEMRSVIAGGPGLVAVGWDEPDSRHAAVWTSVDGLSWSRIPHDDSVFGGLGFQSIASVTVGGPGLVAVGRDRSSPAVWTSTDGTTWSRLIPGSAATDVFATSQGKPARMNAVTAGGPGLVAVGTDGSNAAVWTSVDGMSWSRVPHEDAIFGGEADQEIKSVALADVGLVAVGTDGSRAAVWASTGGRSWVRVPDSGRQSGGDAESIESLTSGGPGVVAVGADRVRGSFRAAVWTSP